MACPLTCALWFFLRVIPLDLAAPTAEEHGGGKQSAARLWCTLVHFGAVVSDAPSPLSTPRTRMQGRACCDWVNLCARHAGRVVAGSVGIVRATVPFHGEHDAQEPTKEG